jgi:hypothetical protein
VSVFFVRDLIAGAPIQTPSMLGTLLFEGPEAARAAVSAGGAAIAFNFIHFAIWVATGAVGGVLMRRVEASAENWFWPWLAVGTLLLLSVLASLRAAVAGLTQLQVLPGMLVGLAAMGSFLAWRYPLAMRRVRRMGAD